ncbi:MAG TPA: hypothetical protein VGG82_07600 [Casimicrobiaceae bacterium]|jgi:Co/Zn/Cd efflux system component
MNAKARVYLIVFSVAMMGAAVIVLVKNQSLSTELLGGVAFLGGLAVLINAVLDITGNGNHHDDNERGR